MASCVTWLVLVLPLVLSAPEPIPEDRYYTVRNRIIKHAYSNNNCLSLDSAHQHSGNNIYVYDCRNDKGYDTYKLVYYNQDEWYIKFLEAPELQSNAAWACVKDDGYYVHSQTCSEDGRPGSYAHQRWSFINTGNFLWLIKNVKTKKCMRTTGHSNYDRVQLKDCDPNDKEQLWHICNLDDNPYCSNLEQVLYGSQAMCCGLHDNPQHVNRQTLTRMAQHCEQRLINDLTYCNTENFKPWITNL